MFNPYQQSFLNYPQTQQNILPQQQILQTNGKPTFETYKMAPNSSILIADSTAPIVWKCVTDGLGNVTSDPFDITPHKEQPALDTTAVMTILTEMNERITKLEESVNVKSTTTRKPNKRNDADVEEF